MSSSPTVHSQFTILSGGICFGDLHNIWHGAISDPMERLHFIPPQVSGTVIVHDVNFNIGARNGAWNVYQLVDIDSCSEVVAWFACHVEIDPQAEVDRILHVSGSPYEPDSGSSRNCEKTVDNGILVINRYDWGYYDERALEDVAEWEHIPDGRVLHNPSEGAGLVDSVGAKDQVVQWRTAPSRTRDSLPSPGGTWMHIPDAEYKFGRFGFDATRRTAQSFLFFTGATHFTNTTFTGVHKSLRKLETAEERFERQIREGYNFEGLDTLHLLASSYQNLPPPAEECFRPFKQTEYILEESDIESILQSEPKGRPICVEWKACMVSLINDLLLSYLVSSVVPACSAHATTGEMISLLWPKRDNAESIDKYMATCFTGSMARQTTFPQPSFDTASVAARLKESLTGRLDNQPDAQALFNSSDEFGTGLARSLGWLVADIFDFSTNRAGDCQRPTQVPSDFRISVGNDPELLSIFKYSWVLWNGCGEEEYICNDPMIQVNRQIQAVNRARQGL